MDIITNGVITICMLGGLLFILISIVGGGFSIREITIPKVPKWMRVISFFVGVVLIYISITPQTPLTTETGSISVSSTPAGASIYLDGNYRGTTPTTIENVKEGYCVITLRLTGYQDWSQTIYIKPDEKTPVLTTLARTETSATTGSISVSSTPSGASVYLDGNYKGTTPLTIPEVEKGSHTITLEYTAYEDWSQIIRVIAGEIAYVSGSLKQSIKRFDDPTINEYRLDWCRLFTEDCGRGAADAFCRSMGYSYAVFFEIDENIGASSPTYVIGTGTICNKDYCDGFKYITCK